MTTMATLITTPETLVTIKVNFDGNNKRYKLPLRDLGASTLPGKLKSLMGISPTDNVLFERYSDSAAAFIMLDPNSISVYKQLYRAAKAKLKLRLRATVLDDGPKVPHAATVEDEEPVKTNATEERDASRAHAKNTMDAMSNVHPLMSSPLYQGPSVADIQRSFEGLLLNRRSVGSAATTPTAPHPTACPTPRCESKVAFSTTPITKIPIKCPYASKSSTEIPVTRGSAARAKWFAELNLASQGRPEAPRAPSLPACSIFTVYCNNCHDAIPDQHYHCSTCDDGDFDLCQTCVGEGVTCNGSDHWLIKRSVSNGKVINSTTQTLAPKTPKPAVAETKPLIVTPQPEVEKVENIQVTRTCNSCIEELTLQHFVTCLHCQDFDLCMTCHVNNLHGHDPKHAFAPTVEGTHMSPSAKALLPAGRNIVHNAVCDGCDKFIHGVRHKCLDCPDWDYCSACILDANYIHPCHRFVPIYEALHDSVITSRSFSTKARHHGIYCDGPLCNNDGHHSYIKGDRYKCAVCDDTDFCANCEASPSNMHNKTHPLIKFKTPVRNCSVTTMGNHVNGAALPTMGDRYAFRTNSQGTETTPAASTNAATQVQTVADLQPGHEIAPSKVEVSTPAVEKDVATKAELVAHFVRDAVADGTILPPNNVFEQTWYLRNGGQTSWPAGCSVKFVGGDNMCAVDPEHPTSVHKLVSAAESTTSYVEVAPGQEVGFTVLMRTPNRIGNYISYWRLTGPDGEKFGHRLWCDVTVKEIQAKVDESAPKVEAEVEAKVEDVKSKVEEVKAEPEVVETLTEQIKKDDTTTSTQGSQMIFPKLEKESPSASVHQAVPKPASMPSTQTDADEFEDFVEESLSGESDDGFHTDDEYDILDASDEEYLAEQAKAAKK